MQGDVVHSRELGAGGVGRNPPIRLSLRVPFRYSASNGVLPTCEAPEVPSDNWKVLPSLCREMGVSPSICTFLLDLWLLSGGGGVQE